MAASKCFSALTQWLFVQQPKVVESGRNLRIHRLTNFTMQVVSRLKELLRQFKLTRVCKFAPSVAELGKAFFREDEEQFIAGT